MSDFINFGGAVLAALLFAASQLGGLYAPQGAKFTQASLGAFSPSLTDYARALGNGTVRDAAQIQLETLRATLEEAARG